MTKLILMPVLISLKVAVTSTIIVFIVGVFLAFIFNKYNFKGKSFCETVILLPMCLPPTVIGYGMLLLMGKNGPIGKVCIDIFGNTLIFTWIGAAVGAAIVSLPLMYQSAKSAFATIDKMYIESARTLGASEIYIFVHIIMPMAIEGILSGVILAFTRGLGEFGASLMIAGNIPGKTQTIPIAIYFAVESGNKLQGNILVTIVIVFSFFMVFWLNRWTKIRR